MGRLPADLSGREVRTALERAGFVFRRQRGSHMVLRRQDPYARVIVPDHKTIRVGTLRQILHDAGLTVEEFLGLVGRRGR
jgi:predicted RNA binding protein YcfA (HicA-like mRNA interferase family)